MKKAYNSPKSETVNFNVEGMIAASQVKFDASKDAQDGQWSQKKNPIWGE